MLLSRFVPCVVDMFCACASSLNSTNDYCVKRTFFTSIHNVTVSVQLDSSEINEIPDINVLQFSPRAALSFCSLCGGCFAHGCFVLMAQMVTVSKEHF